MWNSFNLPQVLSRKCSLRDMDNLEEGESPMDNSYQADDNANQDSTTEYEGNHYATLIRAATPYFDPDSRKTLNLFASVYEVMDSLKSFNQEKGLSAFSLSIKNVDFEGMLKNIRPLCTKKELPFIDKILNIFQIKRMFETYQAFSSMMSMFQPGDTPFQANAENHSNPASSADDFPFPTPQDGFPFPSEEEIHIPPLTPPKPKENPQFNSSSDSYDNFNYETNITSNYEGQIPDYVEAARVYDYQTPPQKEMTSNETTGSSMDTQQMISMLGEMLSPEQKKSFDSMKMLFDSGLFNMNNPTT